MDIKDLEKFFERITDEYGIPVEMRRKGKKLEVSVLADEFSREFLDYDNAVYDTIRVNKKIEMYFNRRGEIGLSVYNPSSGWEDRERLDIDDIRIIGSELEKSKDKIKYTILFARDDEE